MVTKKSKNPLPSSYRGKKRYIVVQLESEKPFSVTTFSNELQQQVVHLFGVVGSAQIKPHVILLDEKKRLAVVRCSHTAVDQVKSALLLLDRMGVVPVRPDILYVSGSIHKIKEKFGLAVSDDS